MTTPITSVDVTEYETHKFVTEAARLWHEANDDEDATAGNDLII